MKKFDNTDPKHPCPTCKTPESITDWEKSRGFQCPACTRRDEAEF